MFFSRAVSYVDIVRLRKDAEQSAARVLLGLAVGVDQGNVSVRPFGDLDDHGHHLLIFSSTVIAAALGGGHHLSQNPRGGGSQPVGCLQAHSLSPRTVS